MFSFCLSIVLIVQAERKINYTKVIYFIKGTGLFLHVNLNWFLFRVNIFSRSRMNKYLLITLSWCHSRHPFSTYVVYLYSFIILSLLFAPSLKSLFAQKHQRPLILNWFEWFNDFRKWMFVEYFIQSKTALGYTNFINLLSYSLFLLFF